MESPTPLPVGTITFLFTDIEGSTRLWEEHPEAMQAALARHDALLRQAIESHGGHVFKTMGDQFCAAFATASAAGMAARDAQRTLHAAARGEVRPLVTLDLRPNNLPAPPTPLLGRVQELEAVCGLLRREAVRLVTLTGPGGTGKTRLGLQIAAELLQDFPEGVFFVDLAPISD